MTLARGDFSAFYAAVNGGHRPFAWQERLLDALMEQGRWPERIVAPTGAGKTSAVDVHVFAVAVSAGGAGPRLPRRLAMVVGRRVLVDDQYERACSLAAKLLASQDDVVREVANRLAGLRWPDESIRAAIKSDTSPLVTGRLRGGMLPSRTWRDHPTACAVLCSTPDMWGSRVLFQGYGTSRLAASREAGMLALDSAVIVDEAHLSGQLLVTARRVAELAAVAEQPISGVPLLQVVETTATPDDLEPASSTGISEVGVVVSDLADEVLSDRLIRPKPVTVRRVGGWPAHQPTSRVVSPVVDEVVAMVDSETSDELSRTVGCFVNTVPMAVQVAIALRSLRRKPPLRVVMVCGQVRPIDIHRLREKYDGLLDARGNPDVDVIVTTQSLEVGVDLDLAGVVTELADGSALAQRAGRVNRRGLRPSGPVVVISPKGTITDRTRSGPYDNISLENAMEWLAVRAADPQGLAPWALRNSPPPAARRQRKLYQRPELADTWHWARTSDDLSAQPELDLWLAESFSQDTSVGLVVRDKVPFTSAEAVQFVQDLPPLRHEVFSVPTRTARSLLKEAISYRSPTEDRLPVVRLRGDEVTVIESSTSRESAARRYIRPGDVLVIDSSLQLFAGGGGEGEGFSPLVAVAEDPDVSIKNRTCASDALHLVVEAAVSQSYVVLRLDLSEADGMIAGVAPQRVAAVARAFLDEETLDGGMLPKDDLLRKQVRSLVETLLDEPTAFDECVRPMAKEAVKLLGRRAQDSDVLLRRDADGRVVRVIVKDRRRVFSDDELRQVITSRSEGVVSLDDHQAAVGARAELLGAHLGLPSPRVEDLRLAGCLHDEGKADARFQRRLGADSSGMQLLAKSDPRSTMREVRDREARAGLPLRWRHEQLSVVRAWETVRQKSPDPELVARLIGTSHGRGRSGFPHAAVDLLDPLIVADPAHQLAAALFDEGLWDELIERTQQRYGLWGCAYLEALLRAADGQVSGEGS
ncbi:MAG: type I-G CRISPR-associated helicase/endonuclease Cas3g [Actinomycetota bacterium]